MLTGDNGILSQAAKAKQDTENAEQNELDILNSYERIIDGETYFTERNVTIKMPAGLKVSHKERENSLSIRD